MNDLDTIAERIRQSFEAHTAARDLALTRARSLTRHSAHAIRAIHRQDREKAAEELAAGKELAGLLRADLADFPSVYHAGYTQDALKEYAEASIVVALLENSSMPSPEDLGLEEATYLKGLAESVGELRRRCLDILREGHSQEAEHLLQHMDDIFSVLVTMDYPDAVTKGLRRLTDVYRGVIERTRGDITLSLRQERLEETIRRAEIGLNDHQDSGKG